MRSRATVELASGYRPCADPEVERVPIRNAEAGCFVARVERGV